MINKRLSNLELLLPSLAIMLKKRGVTKGMVYAKYKAQCADGYMSSAFLERLNHYIQVGKILSHLQGIIW